MMKQLVRASLLAFLMTGLVAMVGCNEEKKQEAAKNDKKKEEPKKDDDHGGWWCNQHGVPENECSMCDDKVYKMYKDKGELCPKHDDRAKSQCFICNPELWEKSAARYKAKEGKDAPWPKDNAPGGKKQP